MPAIELVGRVEHAKIVVDAFLLDVGIGASPMDRRTLQIRGCGTIAAERAFVRSKPPLQSRKIGAVKDEALKVDPFAVKPDLDPAVNDVPGRKVIGKPGDCSRHRGATPS